MKEQKKVKKVGRKPTQNPKLSRFYFRLDEKDTAEFLRRFDESGFTMKADFIRASIFDKELKVVKIDKGTIDFYMRLTSFHSQFRSIGINYNQVVKKLHNTFGKKTALLMLSRLEKKTIELIAVSKEITRITEEFDKKWLQK
ncbi:MAG: hypothetical protein KGV44_06100 [Flavobacteriaceae bacterium]|nr:hypothetical protein [Flavobacteriaceae bacterium]